MKLHCLLRLSTVLALSFACHASFAGGPLQLVTDMDMDREADLSARSTPPFEAKAFVPGAPTIDIASPKVEGPLKAPFPIRVQFTPQGGAEINPASFQALYGAFRFDITDRIVQHAKVSKQGIEVEQANIPPGNHRLTMRVLDNQGRVAEKQISFSVE